MKPVRFNLGQYIQSFEEPQVAETLCRDALQYALRQEDGLYFTFPEFTVDMVNRCEVIVAVNPETLAFTMFIQTDEVISVEQDLSTYTRITEDNEGLSTVVIHRVPFTNKATFELVQQQMQRRVVFLHSAVDVLHTWAKENAHAKRAYQVWRESNTWNVNAFVESLN